MTRKLYRSTKDRMLGGVAGGLGEYFEIDSTLIRILFVITVFLGGTGLLAYILLWIVVPEAPYFQANPQNNMTEGNLPSPGSNEDIENYLKFQEEKKNKRIIFGGIVLVIIGMIFLADNFMPRFSVTDLIPLLIVAAGIGILINATKKK